MAIGWLRSHGPSNNQSDIITNLTLSETPSDVSNIWIPRTITPIMNKSLHTYTLIFHDYNFITTAQSTNIKTPMPGSGSFHSFVLLTYTVSNVIFSLSHQHFTCSRSFLFSPCIASSLCYFVLNFLRFDDLWRK